MVQDFDSLDTTRDKDGFIVLHRTYSDLYKRTTYQSKVELIQNRVYEYDISSANVSMLRLSGKIRSKTLDRLETMSKEERVKAVGLMIRKDHSIQKILDRGLLRSREDLFRANSIQDDEVLSIKKDAVFIIGRKLAHTDFGPVHFRLKNTYAMYIRIENIEFFYDHRNDRVDVKGVSDTVVNHPDHQNGMILFFKQVFKYLVRDQRAELRRFLIDFTHEYKAMKLPYQYYREFNGFNVYRTRFELTGWEYNLVEAGDQYMGIINPTYNYLRYVLPLIRQFM